MQMYDSKILGVILASGIKNNAKDFSADLPSCMLAVGGKPIVQYQIEIMSKMGIKDIIVVVKYNKNKIINYFKDGKKLGVKLTYIEQEPILGIAHTLGKLERHIDTPFLLFLSNIFFISNEFKNVIKIACGKNAAAVLVAEKTERSDFNDLYFGIVLHESGMVKRVIEKPRHMHSHLKGCGMYYFTPLIFDAIRRTPRTAMRDQYEITDSIQILIEDGFPLYHAEVITWYKHVNSLDDLKACQRKYEELR